MITEPSIRVRAGVQTIVCLNGRILLGQRKNVFHKDSWGLPGGQVDRHLKPGGTLIEVGVHKLYEETGLVATRAELSCITDPTPASNYHMQIGILVLDFEGTPHIKQPDFCSKLDFFPLDNLPEPIFVGSVDIIRNYTEGVLYRGSYRPVIMDSRAPRWC